MLLLHHITRRRDATSNILKLQLRPGPQSYYNSKQQTANNNPPSQAPDERVTTGGGGEQKGGEARGTQKNVHGTHGR